MANSLKPNNDQQVNPFSKQSSTWKEYEYEKRAKYTNVFCWLVIILLLGTWGGLYYVAHQYQQQNIQLVKQNRLWQDKLDHLRSKNERTIYLPKAGDAKLSHGQVEAIKDLTSLFSRLTTFGSQHEYNQNYQMAKHEIENPEFFRKYWQAPYDHGTPVVEAQNIKMKNVRTQVLVTGPQTYTVIVTYIPYHSHSDLYQQKKLETRSRIYYVKGTANNWVQVEEAQDMEPNTQIYYDSDIES